LARNSLADVKHDSACASVSVPQGFNMRGNSHLLQSQNELPCEVVRSTWSKTYGQIENWLLGSLVLSKFEQAQFRSLLSRPSLSDKDWWGLVLESWFSNSPTNSVYHTGDTTVSGRTTRSAVSSTTMRRLFKSSSSDVSLVESSVANPLVSNDRVLDALETTDFPLQIEPEDLIGDTTIYLQSSIRHSRSRSISRRPRSPQFGPSTMSAAHDEHSFVSSVSADAPPKQSINQHRNRYEVSINTSSQSSIQTGPKSERNISQRPGDRIQSNALETAQIKEASTKLPSKLSKLFSFRFRR
jgi:hypothetical protein